MIRKLVPLLLIPCLVADPLVANGFSPAASAHFRSSSTLFTRQALAEEPESAMHESLMNTPDPGSVRKRLGDFSRRGLFRGAAVSASFLGLGTKEPRTPQAHPKPAAVPGIVAAVISSGSGQFRLSPQEIQRLIRETQSQKEAIKTLKKNLGWEPSSQNLSVYMTRHGLTAPWQIDSGPRQNPQEVQRLVKNTQTREHAIKMLKEYFGWEPAPDSLSAYMTRHHLTARWQVELGPRQNPREVQRLIKNTQTREHAVKMLKKILGWVPTPAGLSNYMSRHDLTAPWQIDSGPRQNPREVQRLVQNTQSETEAIEILKNHLGWEPSFQNLSDYMTRHDLTAPWQVESGPRQNPQEVQRLIKNTQTREHAVKMLKKTLGWKLTIGSLTNYMTRHHLTAPWRIARPKSSKNNDVTRRGLLALTASLLGLKTLGRIAGGIALVVLALKGHSAGMNLLGVEGLGPVSLVFISLVGLFYKTGLTRRGFFRGTAVGAISLWPAPAQLTLETRSPLAIERDVNALSVGDKAALERLVGDVVSSIAQDPNQEPDFLSTLYSNAAVLQTLIGFLRNADQDPKAGENAARIASTFPTESLRKVMDAQLLATAELPIKESSKHVQMYRVAIFLCGGLHARDVLSAILNKAMRQQEPRMTGMAVTFLTQSIKTRPAGILSPDTGRSLAEIMTFSLLSQGTIADDCIFDLGFAPRYVAEPNLKKAQVRLEEAAPALPQADQPVLLKRLMNIQDALDQLRKRSANLAPRFDGLRRAAKALAMGSHPFGDLTALFGTQLAPAVSQQMAYILPMGVTPVMLLAGLAGAIFGMASQPPEKDDFAELKRMVHEENPDLLNLIHHLSRLQISGRPLSEINDILTLVLEAPLNDINRPVIRAVIRQILNTFSQRDAALIPVRNRLEELDPPAANAMEAFLAALFTLLSSSIVISGFSTMDAIADGWLAFGGIMTTAIIGVPIIISYVSIGLRIMFALAAHYDHQNVKVHLWILLTTPIATPSATHEAFSRLKNRYVKTSLRYQERLHRRGYRDEFRPHLFQAFFMLPFYLRILRDNSFSSDTLNLTPLAGYLIIMGMALGGGIGYSLYTFFHPVLGPFTLLSHQEVMVRIARQLVAIGMLLAGIATTVAEYQLGRVLQRKEGQAAFPKAFIEKYKYFAEWMLNRLDDLRPAVVTTLFAGSSILAPFLVLRTLQQPITDDLLLKAGISLFGFLLAIRMLHTAPKHLIKNFWARILVAAGLIIASVTLPLSDKPLRQTFPLRAA